MHRSHHPVHHLLGLRAAGLHIAIADALYLCVTLFAGPLVYFLHTLEYPSGPHQHPSPAAPPPVQDDRCSIGGTSLGGEQRLCDARLTEPQLRRTGFANGAVGAGAAGSGSSPGAASDGAGAGASAVGTGLGDSRRSGSSLPASLASWLGGWASDLQLWRNLLAAPLTEEFVFRACMAPLLVMEGVGYLRVVLLTPLFFGAAHLHHVVELVTHQRQPLGRALATAGFQMAYTTVFGWLATYLFLRTGHLAAPVVAHMFCNWAGFPPIGDMVAHPRGALLLITTVAGAATFALALQRMTKPERYQQDFYDRW